MKKLLLLLCALLTGVSGVWAYSLTTVSNAQDSKGNALVSGAFYRIALPGRGANFVLKQNGEYIKPNDGLEVVGCIFKLEADDDGKALISTPAGGYWKFIEYAAGNSKLKTTGTAEDCTHFQLAWHSSSSKTLNLFDNSVEGSGYTYDNVYCGYVLSNHGGTSQNMGIYNNITDGGSYFRFERFYQTKFVVSNVDVNGVAVEDYPTTVTINGNITASEYYTNSDNLITSFSTAYGAAYYIDGVEKTAEEVKNAINANTSTLTVTVKPQPFVASTVESPVYYALMISGNANSWLEGSGANVNCGKDRALPGITDRNNWLWQLVQDGTNGYRIYNVGTEKYIGGRTATGDYLTLVDATSANSFISVYNDGSTIKFKDKTYTLWIDRASGMTYAHTSGQQFTFLPMYKVTFSEGVALNGGDAVTTFFVKGDGSDSFTLPSDKLYSINGADPMGYADAVTAIAACTSNITVTVSDNTTPEVTYKLLWNGEALASATTVRVQQVGDDVIAAATLFGDAPAYCSYGTASISTITAETTEVTYELNWSGPFNFSTDYEHAKWYYLKAGDKWAYYGASYNSVANRIGMKNDIASTQAALPSSMWAFVGNPKDGIMILNGKVGESKYVDSNAAIMMMATSNGYAKWTIEEATDAFKLQNGGYYMVYAAISGFNYLQAKSGEGNNANALLTVEAVPYKSLALVFIEQYANSHALGQYFGIAQDSYDTQVSAINDLESLSENDYNSLVANIGLYLSPKLPETGYYRIKSSGARGRTSYMTYGKLNDDKGWGLVTTSRDKDTDYGTIIKLERVGTGKNYKMSTQGLNVQAHTADNTLITAITPTDGTAHNYAFNHINLLGLCSIYDGTSHGNLHEAGWYNSTTGLNGVVGWNAGDGTNASSWMLEDATTVAIPFSGNIGGKSYATFCAPFDVTIGDGAKAYTVKLNDAQDRAVYTEIASKQIPANTGILLISESAASTVEATINTGSAFSALSNNDLVGYNLAQTFAYNTEEDGTWYLALGNSNTTGIGFYKMSSSATAKANRAYLPYDYVAQASGNVKGFRLVANDTATGIDNVNVSENKNNAIYNLAGQRVQKAQKGIYIVNGKKVAVK